MGPSKQQKSQKSAKKPNHNAPTVKTCKNTLSGRGQTSKIDDSYTLLAVFSKAQGSQKGAKIDPKWSLKALKIKKKTNKRALKKTSKHNTAKSRLLAAFWAQNGYPLSCRKCPQNHNNPKNHQNGTPGLQTRSPGRQKDKKT
jgi:hypothetical protein